MVGAAAAIGAACHVDRDTPRPMRAPALRPRFEQLADHPFLVGDPSVPGSRLARRVRWTTLLGIVLANAIGAVVVVSFAVWGLPKPALEDSTEPIIVNVAVAGVYLLVALVVGSAWGLRRIEGGRYGIRRWLTDDRTPTAPEVRQVLRAPLRLTVVQIALWGLAVVLFTALNLGYSALLALGVGLTVALGGMTTSAAAFLLCELALRPVASRALAAREDDRSRIPGVATRWLLAWALGTGVPVLGLILIAIVALTSVEIREQTLAITILALGGIGLLAGATVALLAAYATTHPVRSIRAGLQRVREGDLDAEVPVWDTTEMGLLQAGFNDMVSGLREREKIRDMFGRQVGEDVAQQALDDETTLGGEVREVAVLFVDIVGSTALAAERDPQDVVRLLNRFFAEVVDVVEDAGGWINKFEGDAALAIFGAPLPVDGSATCALKAARRLDERLRSEVGELQAGIGVAVGDAVAGNVGAEQRFEYTVIGDPVNEAARLTDLAKGQSPMVLASADAIAAADDAEAARWKLGDEVELRGRKKATQVACPRPD
jgi:adenylate cyclase